MDFENIYNSNKEILLVIVTAILTIIIQKLIPFLRKGVSPIIKNISDLKGQRMSDAEFEQQYLAWLIEQNRYLKFRGIRTRAPVAIELEDIYISLTVSSPIIQKINHDTKDNGTIHEGISKQHPKEESIERFSKRLEIGEILNNYSNKIVILGGPGSGKTTLLSFIAIQFGLGKASKVFGFEENLLPIFIPLRDLVTTKKALKVDNLIQACVNPEIAENCPLEFFNRMLESGNCIVLLDGMDEVTSEEQRRKLANEIEDFVIKYPDNKFIVTSRPAGYSSVPLTDFSHFEVCDFDDIDIENFVRNWSLSLELAIREVDSEISSAAARREADIAASELLEAIKKNDRVQRLTINPLLLTIVAMVHRYRATLPNRRAELYDECTQVLLGHWDQAKGIAGQLDPSQKRRILEPLAFWLHDKGIRETEINNVERIISEALLTIGETKATGKEFIKNIQERSGLLLERGLNIYGFSHLTFQEYLTASYLIDRGNEGLDLLVEQLYDSWWLEVILLYSGMKDATTIVQKILDQPSDLFRSNIFLAAKCLVDRVNIDPVLENKVLDSLFDEFINSNYKGLQNQAGRAIIELGRSASSGKINEKCFDLLNHSEISIIGKGISVITG